MTDLNDGESTQVTGSGSSVYTLKNSGGVYSCTCPAWRSQSEPIERGSCKHLRRVLKKWRVQPAAPAGSGRRHASMSRLMYLLGVTAGLLPPGAAHASDMRMVIPIALTPVFGVAALAAMGVGAYRRSSRMPIWARAIGIGSSVILFIIGLVGADISISQFQPYRQPALLFLAVFGWFVAALVWAAWPASAKNGHAADP